MSQSSDEDANETRDDSNTESSPPKHADSNVGEQTSKINLNDLGKNYTEDELLVLYVNNVAEDAVSSEDSITRDAKDKIESDHFTEIEVPATQIDSGEERNKISQRLKLSDASIGEDLCVERMKKYEQLSINKNLSLSVQNTLESIMPTVSSNNLSKMRLGECCTRSINEEIHNTETVEQETVSQQPETLEPNNPLMARYQAALEVHLIRQNKKLDEELLNLVSNYLFT